MTPLILLTELRPDGQTACFTGHRPKDIFPDHPYAERRRKDYQEIVGRIRDVIRTLYGDGCRRFLSGGAQGFDQLAFWAVHGLKKECPGIQNLVVVPFMGQESLWADKGLFSKDEYQKMLAHADRILICASVGTAKPEIRDALLYRNQVMVALSGTVIGMASDDGWKEPSARGGTAHCLRLAREQGRNLIIKPFMGKE